MKKILLSVVLSILLFSGCQDVLEKQPLDTISDATVWSDKVLIESYLTQCYGEMCFFFETNYGSRQYWYPFITYQLTNSDEAFSCWCGNPRSNSITISGGVFEWWGYGVIRELNIFLEKLEASTFDDSFKKQKLAEARFLRAFAYFNIVKRYGGIPLITKVQQLNDSDEELYRKRDKENDVYDFILKEADAIVTDLPETYGTKDMGRPTKYAALALKSRAAMYAASIASFGKVQLDATLGIASSKAVDYWNASYNASKAIIESGKFSLYNKFSSDKSKNFRNLFLDEGNSEIIFSERYNGRAGKGSNYDFWIVPRGFQDWGGGQDATLYLEMIESFDNIDGTSGAIDRDKIASGHLWTTDELFGKKDPRFKASVYTQGTSWTWKTGVEHLDYHQGIITPSGVITSGSYKLVNFTGINMSNWGTPTPFGILKYLDEEEASLDQAQGAAISDTDYIIFRLGEIYINLAEAAVELGKNGEALAAINTVRQRAGMPNYQSVTRDLVRKERKIELAFEGNRWFDVRRWRTAVNDLTGNFHGLRFILDGNSFEEGKYNPVTAKYKLEILEHIVGAVDPIFEEKHYYLPIRLSRTSNNPNLVENPGYN